MTLSEEPTDERSGEDPHGSWGDRLIMALPMPPTIRGTTVMWLALGVSHGAWLISYTSVSNDVVMWGALLVAAVAQIGSQL